jgi:beta-N-acetylhexosaminidase
LLYLDNYLSSGDPDVFTSYVRTLVFFAQKYREDPAFAQRVDQSVLRILTLKLKIYNNSFSVAATLPNSDALNSIGLSSRVTFNIAQQAASLISPSSDELNIAILGYLSNVAHAGNNIQSMLMHLKMRSSDYIVEVVKSSHPT